MSRRFLVVAVLLFAFSSPLFAQSRTVQQAGTAAPPPPATKIEAFKPAAGSLVTFGYNELGSLQNVSVDAREIRDTKGNFVRGVTVEVVEGEYQKERAFIDVDELPELLKGIDALLAVTSNPTSFQNFEVRYTTRGDLELTAFNSDGSIKYAIQAGHITKAQQFTDADGLRQLRGMFEKASILLKTSSK